MSDCIFFFTFFICQIYLTLWGLLVKCSLTIYFINYEKQKKYYVKIEVNFKCIVGAATPPHLIHSLRRLHKNRLPIEDKMKLVTYVNIYGKCYLKLFNYFMIVLGERGSFNVLAKAIDNFYRVLFTLKKNSSEFYSNFLTMTDISPSVISTCQSILSPASIFNTFAISLGNPTRRDLDLGFA